MEIDQEPTESKDSGKEGRQQKAREKMHLEDKRFFAEREAARKRLKLLEDRIRKAELDGSKVSDLEFEAQAIEAELGTFEREG